MLTLSWNLCICVFVQKVDESKKDVHRVLTDIDQKAEPNLREYRRVINERKQCDVVDFTFEIVAQKEKEIRAMRKRHLEVSMKWDEKLKQKTQDVRRLQKVKRRFLLRTYMMPKVRLALTKPETLVKK